MQRQQHPATILSTPIYNILQVTQLPLTILHQSSSCTKKQTMSQRFRQQVQKLKLQGENMYRLILTVQGQRQQSRSIDMKFMFSYADMEISPQYKFTIEDMSHFPIIDTLEPYTTNNNTDNNSNKQVYHKIRTIQKRKKTMKYINFRTLNDYMFKKGLYQISLYQRLQHNMLQDYFVIYKGEIKQLVMVFNYSYVTLHDVLSYRKLVGYQWTEMELLMVVNMLCQNLIQMKRVNVVHRDVRPAKVFFSPVLFGERDDMYRVNYKSTDGNTNRGNLNNNNYNKNSSRFYNFMNLQSARVYQPQYNNNTYPSGMGQQSAQQTDTDLLTVKGVPAFTDSPVKQALQRDQHKANYNPYRNDINGLKNILVSLINLQPNNLTHHVIQQRLLHKSRIRQLLKFISLPSVTLQQVNQKVLLLMGVTSIARPTYYYNMMREFYTKELTICQNIQMNLYFNSRSSGLSVEYAGMSKSYGYQQQQRVSGNNNNNNNNNNASLSTVEREQANNNRNINNNNNNINNFYDNINNFSKTGKQFVQDLYIRALYDLHKKDIFVPFILQKLAKNFQLNKRQQNVTLLMKVGRYFEQAGVKENEYYKQAVTLLLQLSQQQRLQGFYKDHQRLIVQAEQILNKFQPQAKMVARIRCGLLKEKAYKQLYSINNNNNNQSPQLSSHINQSYNQQKQLFYPTIESLINQSYELAMKSNLPFEQQLQLIYSKAELYLLMNKIQSAETFYLTGYQLTEKNYKQFMTVHNCTKYKGLFQYGLAMVDLIRLKSRGVQKTPKLMFILQNKLNNAKQRFSSISIHPVHVIKCYMALGDLSLLKQDPQQAIANYQKGLNLLHASNTQSNQRSISAEIQLSIVHQIINLTQNVSDMQKYQLLYEGLKRETNKEKKLQKKYSRKGKIMSSNNNSGLNSNNNSNKQSRQQLMLMQQKQQQHQHQLPIIRQQEQQNNKMFQSQRIINNLPFQQQQSVVRRVDPSSNSNRFKQHQYQYQRQNQREQHNFQF